MRSRQQVRPPTWFRCSIPPSCAPPSQPLEPKGAGRPSPRPLARRLLDQTDLKADFDGQPIAFDLTAGQASDSRHSPILLDLGPEITPRAALGDKGCDTKANRGMARSRGICPIIPFRRTAKNRPAFFPRALYRGRARIKQTVGKLKRFKRIALRCAALRENRPELRLPRRLRTHLHPYQIRPHRLGSDPDRHQQQRRSGLWSSNTSLWIR